MLMNGINLSRNSRSLRRLEQSLDHLVDRDPLRLRAVVEQDAMPQRWVGQLPDILRGYVRSSLQKSARFAAQDQKLPCPRPRAPTGPFIDKIRRAILTGSRGRRNPDCITDDFFRNRYLANNIVKAK